MICPQCSYEKLVLLESTQTCMHFPDFKDEDGLWHHHDENRGRNFFRCMGCKHEFATPNYNFCWCGWTNQYSKLSKTHKEENYTTFEGFKSTERVITNNEWINNLQVKKALGKHDFPINNKSTEYPE